MRVHNANQRRTAFTLVEILVTTGVFGLFAVGLFAVWSGLGFTALNTNTFAQRQNDQMRVLDYLKRDIRRATTVQLYNGAVLVTDTTTFASELRLTIPDYYADSREDDNAIGTKLPNTPVSTGGMVNYGTPLTIRYYALNGAGIRNEAGILRTVANAAGAFAFSFKRETSGAILSRVFFDQPMRGGSNRTLRRQVDTLCVPRAALLP